MVLTSERRIYHSTTVKLRWHISKSIRDACVPTQRLNNHATLADQVHFLTCFHHVIAGVTSTGDPHGAALSGDRESGGRRTDMQSTTWDIDELVHFRTVMISKWVAQTQPSHDPRIQASASHHCTRGDPSNLYLSPRIIC